MDDKDLEKEEKIEEKLPTEEENAGNEEPSEELEQDVLKIKSKSNFQTRLLSIFLILIFGGACFFGGTLFERVDPKSGVLQGLKLKKIEKLIDDNYYFSDKIDHNRAYSNAVGGYVASFEDPFTYYLDESSFSSFNETMSGDYVGIGVEVTVDKDNFITIINVFDNGAASEKGIIPGDRIIKVDGKAVSGEKLDEAVAQMKGHEGMPVDITILRSDKTEKKLTLTRKAVQTQTVKTKMIDKNMGYVKISSFGNDTAKEFEKEIGKINNENLKSLIIDLRNNPGGALDSVVKIADIIMPEGTIVTTKYKNQKDETYKSDAKCINVPICVLINEGTASASELLAGALRDNCKATLVGKKSFGKGVVGTLFPVDSKTAVVITTGEYFLPNGKNIHKVGILPTIEVDPKNKEDNYLLVQDADDTQLQKAIEVLKANGQN